MCGRFTLTYRERERLAEELGVPYEEISEVDYKPRYNIAPTDPHWIVRLRYEERHVLPAKWGLVNAWAKDASKAARQINARAETLKSSGAFREALAKRRCVVPADGFYEWIGTGSTKQPVWFHRDDGKLILFAGLYESWQPKPEEWQRTFTIITTEPNGVVAPVHNRMPVVLDDAAIDAWLDPQEEDLDKLTQLLRPAPDSLLVGRTVSSKANSVKNDDPSVLEPAEVMARLL
ncbi:MAG TPA: SOS response-associated peptidase [Dehalococcoidia bacterium]|jgi:putative SOS response-associated peptidase YedK|nr:SOS response-associated peptidase [Dehalococcoidia bacterium]